MLSSPPRLRTTTNYFDVEAALDRCCGDVDFLAEMVDLLASSVLTQMTAIEVACAARCPRELGEAAHALKGSISTMTSSVPYELARDLESLGKSGTCEGADIVVSTLRASLHQLLKETQQWSAHRESAPVP